MSNELRFETGFIGAPTGQPGLVMHLDGTVWVVAPDGSESQLAGSDTDDEFHFVQSATEPPLFPVVAYDNDALTLTVTGDCAGFFFSLGSTDNNGDGIYFVSGSTDNDGIYGFGADPTAVYNAETGKTVVTLADGDVFSGPADGDLQPLSTFIQRITIPPGGAVEWVLVNVISGWVDDSEQAIGFLWVGDDQDGTAFVNISAPGGDPGPYLIQVPGKYQWPLKTIDVDATALLPGTDGAKAPTSPGYKSYLDGGIVQVIIQGNPGSVGGEAIVVVHHHFGEVTTAVPVS